MPYINYNSGKVFYDVEGKGYPLLLLHGNAVSSMMFRAEIDFYKEYFQVIYFDYPGVGKSGRLKRFSDDFWFYNAGAAKALAEHLKLDKFHVIGTSGGALVGLNLAGLLPEKISKMIVDSFFGFRVTIEEVNKIITDRTKAKKEILSASFWEDMHGSDWESIIDMDLDLMLRTATNNVNAIKTDLSRLEFPVLGIVSEEDELVPDIVNRMSAVIEQIPNGKLIIFKKGKHPFMITKRQKFRDIAIQFLTSD